MCACVCMCMCVHVHTCVPVCWFFLQQSRVPHTHAWTRKIQISCLPILGWWDVGTNPQTYPQEAFCGRRETLWKMFHCPSSEQLSGSLTLQGRQALLCSLLSSQQVGWSLWPQLVFFAVGLVDWDPVRGAALVFALLF